MAKALAPRMDAVEKKVEHLDKRVERTEADNKRQDTHLQRLDTHITDLRARLDQTATKDDIAATNAHIDQSVNGILRDALNSTPLWVTVLFGFVSVAATLASMYFGLLHAAR